MLDIVFHVLFDFFGLVLELVSGDFGHFCVLRGIADHLDCYVVSEVVKAGLLLLVCVA
jgi:hypothetical protein